MAKRSRKLSTRRPRRSKSSSRKTMKRTKRQPSKKRTLKKHSSKKRKSRTKSVRKRKKTKKVMKGGVFDGTYTPVFVDGEVRRGNIQQISNGEAEKLLENQENKTWLIRERETPLDGRGAYILMTYEEKGKPISFISIMETNTSTNNIKYWFRSNPEKTYTSLEALITKNSHLFPKEKELYMYINPEYQTTKEVVDAVDAQREAEAKAKAKAQQKEPTLPLETPDVLPPESPYYEAEEYENIDYKVSKRRQKDEYGRFYRDLTLLDGENHGGGTTVKIFTDITTKEKSIPTFKLVDPNTPPPVVKTVDDILEYYKTHKFIYIKYMGKNSKDVLLGNEHGKEEYGF